MQNLWQYVQTLIVIEINEIILNLGEGQNLEQLNLERPIFRTSEISNIKRTKDKLFHFIIFDFFEILIFV